MNLNGKEVVFCYTSLEDARRLTDAANHIAERLPELTEAEKAGWGPQAGKTIELYAEYLRTATCVDVLEGCTDVGTAEEVYFAFLEEVERQRKAYESEKAERIRKYREKAAAIRRKETE